MPASWPWDLFGCSRLGPRGWACGSSRDGGLLALALGLGRRRLLGIPAGTAVSGLRFIQREEAGKEYRTPFSHGLRPKSPPR
jgi:hypothetical protein